MPHDRTVLFALGCALLLGAGGCDISDRDQTDAGEGDSDRGGPTDDGGGGDDEPAPCTAQAATNVPLVTRDGVTLIADLYTTSTRGGPGVVLLHMIPPNTKDNYPPAFIEALRTRGFHVVNVNRRGAAGSGGDAEDGYIGPNAKYDALAGVTALTSHPCAVDPARVAYVGASNGTTSITDLSVFAATDPSIAQPFAMVYLSGGTYTERQSPLLENADVLDNHPTLFAYPSSEASWNQGIQNAAPAAWTFTEVSPGAHGTRMFDTNPETIAAVADFIQGALGR